MFLGLFVYLVDWMGKWMGGFVGEGVLIKDFNSK